MRSEPRWVDVGTVRHIHHQQISLFGGIAGTRDQGMLLSALSRLKNVWLYAKPSLFDLAAAYAYGISQNHPFVDGNKRTAFVVSVLFIELNGFEFTAPEVDSATVFLSLAASALTEAELATWFERWSIKARRE